MQGNISDKIMGCIFTAYHECESFMESTEIPDLDVERLSSLFERSLYELGYDLTEDSTHKGSELSSKEVEYVAAFLSDHVSASYDESVFDGNWKKLPYSRRAWIVDFVTLTMRMVTECGIRTVRTRLPPFFHLFNRSSGKEWFDSPSVPLIVSAVGHHNAVLNNEGLVRAQLHNLFETLRTRYPHTRIILKTGLDEGIDLIASEVALNSGAYLAPVFPKNYLRYVTYREKQYDVQTRIDNIDRLLSHERCFEPYILNVDDTDEDLFRYLAIELVSSSHLVVGVWDGAFDSRTGGTYDTIQMALFGIHVDLKERYATRISKHTVPSSFNYLDVQDECPVYWIKCSRENEPLRENSRKGEFLVPRSMTGQTYYSKKQSFLNRLKKKECENSALSEDGAFGKFWKETGGDVHEAKGSVRFPFPLGDRDSEIEMHDRLPAGYDVLFRNIDEFNKEFCEPVRYTFGSGQDMKLVSAMLGPSRGERRTEGHGTTHAEIVTGVEQDIRPEFKKILSKSSSNHYYSLLNKSEERKVVRKNTSLMGSVAHLLGFSKGNERTAAPTEPKDPSIETLERCGSFELMATRYSISDKLSVMNRDDTKKEMKRLASYTVVTSALFSLLMLMNSPLLINMAYVILSVVLMLSRARHERNRSFHRYLDYRCISEYYRIEFYRAITEIRDPFCVPAYGYMRNELMWVRAVIKGWGAEFANRDSYVPPLRNTLDIVHSCWIMDQEEYHHGKKYRNAYEIGSRIKIKNALSLAMLALSFCLLISGLLFQGLVLFDFSGIRVGDLSLLTSFEFTIDNIIRISMILLLAISSTIVFSQERVFGGTPNEIFAKECAFHEASLLYDSMLEGNRSVERRLALIHELGDLAITEVNDWVFEHKTRDFKKTEVAVDTSGG